MYFNPLLINGKHPRTFMRISRHPISTYEQHTHSCTRRVYVEIAFCVMTHEDAYVTRAVGKLGLETVSWCRQRTGFGKCVSLQPALMRCLLFKWNHNELWQLTGFSYRSETRRKFCVNFTQLFTNLFHFSLLLRFRSNLTIFQLDSYTTVS